jgi:hypothetical protein
LNDVKENFFAVADGSEVLVFVVFGDCGLVHENVFVGVVSVDETVAVSNVEPFHTTGDTVSDDGFFGGSWSVSSGLVVILGFFSADVGGWFFLSGFFSNFGGHLVFCGCYGQWFLRILNLSI